jgi:hypothetical protein
MANRIPNYALNRRFGFGLGKWGQHLKNKGDLAGETRQ